MKKLLLLATTVSFIGGMTMAGGSYDGVYTGTRTTKPLRPSATNCPAADNVAATITVTGNRFTTMVANETHDIEVAADGTIKASIQYRTSGAGLSVIITNFIGKIVNGDFQMDRGNEYCATHISLKKS